MSLVITLHTSEGIVMASDSRISFAMYGTSTGHFTDNEYKTFLCPNNCGISHCGASTIDGKKLAGLIESFIRQEINDNTAIHETAQKLQNYISMLNPNLCCVFHVAGYDQEENKHIAKKYRVITGVNPAVNEIVMESPVFWDGETTVLTKILNTGFICNESIPLESLSLEKDGETAVLNQVLVLPTPQTLVLPKMDILWNFMTLQDAIDFARYAINTTIETMRFTNVNKTVGGPIDILVIKPDSAQWISHKELH